MVKIYTISVRYQDGNGHSYTTLGYYLTRAKAIYEAHRYYDRRSALSRADKIIVQEISIGPENAAIELIDWIIY